MKFFTLGRQVTTAAAITLAVFGISPVLGVVGEAFAPDATFEVLVDEAAERAVSVMIPAARASQSMELETVLGSETGEGEAVASPEATGGEAPVATLRVPSTGNRYERTPTVVSTKKLAGPVQATHAKKKKKKRKGCEADPNTLVTKTAGNRYTVDRAILKPYTRSWSALNDLGWSRQHDGADGRSDGMQIGGISCGNDLHDSGFRSGDVIHSVNGIAVRSIPEALMVYGRVKKDETLTVRITRRGNERVLTFKLFG